MYRTTCFAFLFFFHFIAFAQKDSIDVFFTFRITDYTVELDDSTTIVQIAIPGAWPMRIPEKQIGVLKDRYEQGTEYDTAMIGWGRCYLIKDEWHYFTIHQKQHRKPEQGDLLVTQCRMLKTYTSLLFNLTRLAISLTRVDDSPFYNSAEAFYFEPKTEQDLLDSMAADIRFTGKAMLLQNKGKDQLIKGGLFNGKKLFVAMQTIKRDAVEKFLKYVVARPAKYAGNVWKISEIFATWMANKTPEVVDDDPGQE